MEHNFKVKICMWKTFYVEALLTDILQIFTTRYYPGSSIVEQFTFYTLEKNLAGKQYVSSSASCTLDIGSAGIYVQSALKTVRVILVSQYKNSLELTSWHDRTISSRPPCLRPVMNWSMAAHLLQNKTMTDI